MKTYTFVLFLGMIITINAQYSLHSSVFGGGGTVSGGTYILRGSVFQPNVGLSEAGSYKAKSGFWAVYLNKVTSGSVLPVELNVFTASLLEEKVILNWQTATEVNNYGFQVERQKEKGVSEWEVVGFVEGHGNSNSPKDYTFTDNILNLNLNLNLNYRLKQIDFDGNCEYSDEIAVELAELVEEYKLEQNYPNPFNPSTTISYSIPNNVKSETSNVKLVVYDILGNEVATLVNERQKTGNYEVKFNASNLASGIYLYKLQSGSFVQTRKLMLLK